jgi:predicted ATPase
MLAALNREETRALLASVFGNSLYLQTLSDRLFEISLGVPGETLALTQHLIDNDAIRYQDGQWSLPRELDANQLPARATDVFAERIAALPPLARRIAEAQALLGSVLRHEDYALLAPEVSAAARDEAVLSLQTCGIVQYDGEFYNLRDRTLTKLLCDLLGPEQRRARHLTLHALYRAQPDAHPYLIVHHLL